MNRDAIRQDRKRFTTEQFRDIEDVADPHTNEDDTREPISAKLKRNWKTLAVVVPVTLAAVAIVIGYTWHLIPELLTNTYVQLGTLFSATIAASVYIGDRRRKNLYEQYDWLVLRTDHGPQQFLGKLKQNADGAPLFQPVKGTTRFGGRGEPYTIEEFSRELGETWASINRDPDDPALIRLHPAMASVATTDRGTVVEQSTTELTVDPFARDATLHAPLPEFIEDDVSEQLRAEIKTLREEREEIEDRLEKVQRRLEAAKDVGAMTPDEFLQSHKEFYRELREVDRGRRPSSGASDPEQSIAPSTDDPMHKQIESDLTADD